MSISDFKVTKRNATLRGLVEDNIREAILSGHFKPGQRLVERELCELLDVSRTSVREALRQLEAEGIIHMVPHKGPIVAVMSRSEARQLYALRALLEGYAGAEFAKSGPPELKAKLSESLEEFERLAKGEQSDNLLGAKAGFYDLLIRGCNNVFVGQTLESMYNRIALLRLASMGQPGRLVHSLTELKRIVAAIQAGDAEAAREACHQHIENACAAALLSMPADE